MSIVQKQPKSPRKTISSPRHRPDHHPRQQSHMRIPRTSNSACEGTQKPTAKKFVGAKPALNGSLVGPSIMRRSRRLHEKSVVKNGRCPSSPSVVVVPPARACDATNIEESSEQIAVQTHDPGSHQILIRTDVVTPHTPLACPRPKGSVLMLPSVTRAPRRLKRHDRRIGNTGIFGQAGYKNFVKTLVSGDSSSSQPFSRQPLELGSPMSLRTTLRREASICWESGYGPSDIKPSRVKRPLTRTVDEMYSVPLLDQRGRQALGPQGTHLYIDSQEASQLISEGSLEDVDIRGLAAGVGPNGEMLGGGGTQLFGASGTQLFWDMEELSHKELDTRVQALTGKSYGGRKRRLGPTGTIILE